MSVPMRKEEPEFEDNLTTADLAQGKRPVSEDSPKEYRPKPILAGPSSTEIAQDNRQPVASGVGSTTDVTPLFPNNELEELRNRWTGRSDRFRRRTSHRCRAG